jgi:small subunit ribosomal protein S11
MKKKVNSLRNLSNLKKKNLFHNSKYCKHKCVIHIKCSFNNTIITLTDLNGNTKGYCSCGSVGFKGAKRSSKFAGAVAAEHIGRKASKLGYRQVRLNCKGFGRGRFVIVKGLKKSRLKIIEIRDVTPLPHNGCRSKKLRRL